MSKKTKQFLLICGVVLMIATIIPQTNAAEINQEAMDALYGTWGYSNSEPYVSFAKEDIGSKFDVLEAVVESGVENSYRIKLKIHIQNPYIAEMTIFNGGRGYGWNLVMTMRDLTNNQVLVTDDNPLVKAKKR